MRPPDRPVDYWDQNLLDRLISILPDILIPQGKAFLMQLSILNQLCTVELLEEAGLQARVIDFDTFNFGQVFLDRIDQIRRVEQLADAYHFTLGRNEVIVAYLLEVTCKDG